ncbi:AfsR/SARP family transcriptional regulator [Geodermatophilus chilensis]|uniref:AfsR/SARP family transcriptional regulator n=1 Tax=Geodermatophilus chilensis TaxID=2035835 RepID=UPI000C25A24F|nr:BTAD domain-containing putative transcriptional regulator [Geodermatophilus chilensis]
MVCDGRPALAPRGNKAWALLAYLVLTERPPTRQQVVSLLFPEALDPLRALRWNLTELRRVLRGVASLTGDPLVLTPVPGCAIDVRLLTEGSPAQALSLDGFGRELLEGVAVPDAPAFEAWLAAERCRVATCGQTVVVEQSLNLLTTGEARGAARLAARAVAMDPLNADHHALLVRSLATAGDHLGAQRQAERCADLFRRELGCSLPAEVVAAARPAAVHRRPASGPAAVRSLLDVGRASLAAGAVNRGIEQLERAAATAVDLGDPVLRATAFVALAGARVHGAGERGTAVRALLQDAAACARQAQAGDLAAAACRELGFLALQRGHHDRALVWLDEGERLATDDGERARLLGVRGMCLTDGADYGDALSALTSAVRLARLVGDSRQVAWSLSMVGRLHVLRGEHARAVAPLDTALDIVGEQGWTAFQPWPEAFRAEAAIGSGCVAVARELLDHAWVLATESVDHCWMATVAHGHARLALAARQTSRAQEWVDRGLAPSPWYLWPYARLLDTACSVALQTGGAATAQPMIDRLIELAGRASMRDLLVRAHLHRARTGSRPALAAARALAAEVDDPALRTRIHAESGVPA